MMLEAIHPDGRREMLTDATHYEQNWQITYKYKTPHLFPAGTILHTVSWHDNTANNKHNPDPTAWVGWGSRTMDEMGHGWTDIAFLTDEQYQRGAGEAPRAEHDDDQQQQQQQRGHVRAGPLGTGLSASALNGVRHVASAGLVAVLVLLSRLPASRRSAAPTNGEWRAWGGDLGVDALRAARSDQRRATSTSSRSPGASRPTTSASAPTSTCRRRR